MLFIWQETVKQIPGFYSLPGEAGKVVELVKPKLAVYSHIVILAPDNNLKAGVNRK